MPTIRVHGLPRSRPDGQYLSVTSRGPGTGASADDRADASAATPTRVPTPPTATTASPTAVPQPTGATIPANTTPVAATPVAAGPANATPAAATSSAGTPAAGPVTTGPAPFTTTAAANPARIGGQSTGNPEQSGDTAPTTVDSARTTVDSARRAGSTTVGAAPAVTPAVVATAPPAAPASPGSAAATTATPAGPPTIPAQRRGSVLGYLAEMEPLMEPTGGYPIILTRPTTPAPVPAAEVPAAAPRTGGGGGDSSDRTAEAAAPRRRWWLVLVILLLVVVVVLSALLFTMRNRPSAGPVSLPLPTLAAAQPTPAPLVTASPVNSGSPAAPGAGASGPGSAAGGATSTGSLPPSMDPSADVPRLTPATLRASYANLGTTGLLGLTGYRGRITVTNTGQTDASTWTVLLTLPDGEKVADVSGALAVQDGNTVTFVPTADTGAVAAGDYVLFTFTVTGVLGGQPTGCAINDQPCD
jgi:hypothetical protein